MSNTGATATEPVLFESPKNEPGVSYAHLELAVYRFPPVSVERVRAADNIVTSDRAVTSFARSG